MLSARLRRTHFNPSPSGAGLPLARGPYGACDGNMGGNSDGGGVLRLHAAGRDTACGASGLRMPAYAAFKSGSASTARTVGLPAEMGAWPLGLERRRVSVDRRPVDAGARWPHTAMGFGQVGGAARRLHLAYWPHVLRQPGAGEVVTI